MIPHPNGMERLCGLALAAPPMSFHRPLASRFALAQLNARDGGRYHGAGEQAQQERDELHAEAGKYHALIGHQAAIAGPSCSLSHAPVVPNRIIAGGDKFTPAGLEGS